MADLRPTPTLRWVNRRETRSIGTYSVVQVLQQFWAEDMPSYMRDQAKGEWRDVPIEEEK